MTTRREFLEFVTCTIAGVMLPREQEPTGFDALVAECPPGPMTYEEPERGVELLICPNPDWTPPSYSDDGGKTWTVVDIDWDNPFGISAPIEELDSV